MKTLKQACDSYMASFNNRENKLVHFYASSEGYKPIDPPVFAADFVCPFCGNPEYLLWMINKEDRAWMCSRICSLSKLPKEVGGGCIAPLPVRAVPWALWCEYNGIGDLMYEVRFEKIDQSKGKVDYLLKFATKPSGIILMQGNKGLGKTYACLGVCELFTRTNSSCVFMTNLQLMTAWLETFKPDYKGNLLSKLLNCQLLVIDDFGTAEVSSGFMRYFLDLINSRMQWSDRGTIITTNLTESQQSDYCGEALMDRLNTGQKFIFEGKTRRVSKPL